MYINTYIYKYIYIYIYIHIYICIHRTFPKTKLMWSPSTSCARLPSPHDLIICCRTPSNPRVCTYVYTYTYLYMHVSIHIIYTWIRVYVQSHCCRTPFIHCCRTPSTLRVCTLSACRASAVNRSPPRIRTFALCLSCTTSLHTCF